MLDSSDQASGNAMDVSTDAKSAFPLGLGEDKTEAVPNSATGTALLPFLTDERVAPTLGSELSVFVAWASMRLLFRRTGAEDYVIMLPLDLNDITVSRISCSLHSY